MNSTLLARFGAELRGALRWHYFEEPRWFAPVLSLPFDRGRHHLVAVLEAPGPFCFVRDASPFGGATAPARLSALKGAQVEDVSVTGRELRIDLITRQGGEKLALRVDLFGANGRAVLQRGDVVLETVGRALHGRKEPAHNPGREAAHALHGDGRFTLVSTRRIASAAPHALDAGSARMGPNDPAVVLGTFDDARSACAFAGERVLGEAQTLMLHRIARPARKKLDSLRRLLENLESDLAAANTHGDERREAEALAAYQTRVRPGTEHVDVPDPYDPGRTLHIALDPAMPVHVQVEKRFRRAARLEKALAHLTRRQDLVRRELSELDAALAMLTGVGSFGEALKLYEVMRAKFGIALEKTPAAAMTSPRKTAREKTYRTFDLDPRWFVIVGRSNHENDEITFRVAAPSDWWFHAEGVAGSHVVLRPRGGSDAPPARVIQQAASIAAHFSKARHSGLVPVIYTRRRYVRKFRGAEPGQVRCERETMVMVPPGLPGGESQ